MRNMSFSATTEQVLAQSKTVTRRLKWEFLKVGDLVQPVLKGMGIPKGGKVKKLGCPIRIISVRREELWTIAGNYKDIAKEGFPKTGPTDFIRIFLEINNCRFDPVVTRIEFEYTEPSKEVACRCSTHAGNAGTKDPGCGLSPAQSMKPATTTCTA